MRDTIQRVERELRSWTGVRYEIEDADRGRHSKLRFVVGEQVRRQPFSRTSMSSRAQLNLISDIRRLLRDMGAERMER